MRRSGTKLIIGLIVLVAATLIPGAAAARQTAWTVTPGGTFSGHGTITLSDMTCSLSFQGSFYDNSGQGQIQTVSVPACSGQPPLSFPSFQVPIGITATKYFDFIDTVTGPLTGVIIQLSEPCPVTFAGPEGPTDPARMEALHQNESSDMWWSSGTGSLTVWDPTGCYDKEAPSANWEFAITPAQTIRPST